MSRNAIQTQRPSGLRSPPTATLADIAEGFWAIAIRIARTVRHKSKAGCTEYSMAGFSGRSTSIRCGSCPAMGSRRGRIRNELRKKLTPFATCRQCGPVDKVGLAWYCPWCGLNVPVDTAAMNSAFQSGSYRRGLGEADEQESTRQRAIEEFCRDCVGRSGTGPREACDPTCVFRAFSPFDRGDTREDRS